MGASPRERSFSTNPCSLANPSPIEVGRPRYLGPVDLSPARVGPVIAARVGLRSRDCLVDCSRNGESACPCKWSRSRSHSSYTRRFFVEGLTAAFDAGELYIFADLAYLNEVKALSARKAGQVTKASPYEMVPRSRRALSHSWQFADVADPIVQFENVEEHYSFAS